jgi:hypothetical protein
VTHFYTLASMGGILMNRVLFIFFLACISYPSISALKISTKQAQEIGQRVWMNECAGTIEGLTSWNEGEEFASLGIGHFIWCPKGKVCPFSESFPRLIAFLKDHKVKVPAWLKQQPACPWNSRKDFLNNLKNPKMIELRTLLSQTIELQTEFIIERLEQAVPTMLRSMPDTKKVHIKRQFNRLEQTPQGTYALIDYVNFKGEGFAVSENYNGQGWGLLHVLENMKGTSPHKAPEEFVFCAKRLLTQRVKNAPPARNESRWLPGWKNRLDTYTRYIPS